MPRCKLSPAELLMGHRLCTDIPQVKKHFVPNWPHVANFNTLDKKFKSSRKHNYDKSHQSKQLPELPDKLPVWVESQGKQAPRKSFSKLLHLDHTQLKHPRVKFVTTVATCK